ncbi:c-type cytochrome [Limnobacter humi]|uniref:C-type cytochrome n=1 Tax=Limnobacter humi TaxID=1778671 RepID=A0ABT1WFZ3_9BURK|nr:c-type cytochrome [Limnobacter humi]MCQ8895672.1 c-type cytochrome [Limnobacter humi]
MSDSNEHELPFKTPKQLIVAIVASFVVPVFIIILLANYVSTGNKPAAGSNAMTDEAIAERLKPVGSVEFLDANAPKVLKTGQEVYTGACAACHGAGAAGAPKFGDKGQWGPRLSQGFDTLWKHAVEGIRAMPAKGGNPDLDDVEVGRAVAYMANEAGANFKAPEPAAPAAAPAADGAAAPAVPAAK